MERLFEAAEKARDNATSDWAREYWQSVIRRLVIHAKSNTAY
jgi:hypothetical protein